MRHIHHPHGGPSFVRNRTYDDIARLVRTIHAYRDVGAVCGPSGVGKTFAAERAARDACELVFYVSLTRRPSRKEALITLTEEVTGKRVNAEGHVLRHMLEDALADRAAIVVIDEVHRLDDVVLDQLSHLHSHAHAQWTLLLVGAPKLAVKLKQYEHLRSRCESILTVERLSGEELADTVRRLHPWFRYSPHDLLMQIDAELCNGSMREWARFHRAVADLDARLGGCITTVDARVAAAASLFRQGGSEVLE